MTTIQRISRLIHPSVLRDFTWPAELPNFGRWNLIYGWNGSGKTTLSRIFRHLENQTQPMHGRVSLRVDGREVEGDEFPNTSIPIRVFNRDFINESVFPVGDADVPPIYVLGRDSVQKQQEIGRLREQVLQYQSNLDDARTDRRQVEGELDRHCTFRGRNVKESLRVSGPGAYNNFDKADYRRRADEMISADNQSEFILDDATLQRLASLHRETIKPKVRPIPYRFPRLTDSREAVAAVCRSTVTAFVISALEDDPSLSSWVHSGLKLHQDRDSSVCLFCEQSLPTTRFSALEAHFSTEYDQFSRRIDGLITDLTAISKQAREVDIPHSAALYEGLRDDFDSATRALKQELDGVQAFVDILVRALEQKRHKPFTSVNVDVAVPNLEEGSIERLNSLIQEHNASCDDFQSKTSEARRRLADSMVAETLDEYRSLVVRLSRAECAIEPIETELGRVRAEIARLEREIIEHRQPADELNTDLHKYLGHNELTLEIKDTGYRLVRHGAPAHNLSDGERTAIALLYFLKSLVDRRFKIDEGIVILDDPISSLDANSLYLAFGHIRERTQEVAQLFVFTHNFTFFRQVRNWFGYHNRGRGRDPERLPAHFYMLDRVPAADPRCTTLQRLDPMLEQHESEYHFLFSCIYREARADLPSDLERAYFFPNVARRLLEMFLAFRRPETSGDLWQTLKTVRLDEAKKTRIYRFVQTYSHGLAIGEPEHDPSILGEWRSVLSELLELIEAEDNAHFTSMVDVVTRASEDAAG